MPLVRGFAEFPDISEVIQDRARLSPEREAVRFVRDFAEPGAIQSPTYEDLDTRARAITATLQRRFAPGSRALLTYPPGPEFVSALVGCSYAAVVAVPGPLVGGCPHQQQRLYAIAANAAAAVVLTNEAYLTDVSHWADTQLHELPCVATDTIEATAAHDWVKPSLGRQSLLVLQYTSGSTEAPRGVMISHGNVLKNIASLQHCVGFSDQMRFGGWIPLYHDMGLFAQLMPALLLGSTYVFMNAALFVRRPHLWLRLIDEHDVACSAAPNFAYELCCRRVSDERLVSLDLSRWKIALNGSEPVRPSTLRRFCERFRAANFEPSALRPGYGLAEATVLVSACGKRTPVTTRIDRARVAPSSVLAGSDELVSCGRCEQHTVCIVDPQTRRNLPDGALGEIWVRGENGASGYFANETATRATFGAEAADGDGVYLRTGDLGMVRGGELYPTGRLEELVLIHGRKPYPQDIEDELLQRHAALGFRAAAAFAAPLGETEEGVVVVQEVRAMQENEGRLADIARAIGMTVAREFGAPVAGVVLVRPGTIERTTSGKIRRAAMRTRFPEDPASLEPLWSVVHPGLRTRVSRPEDTPRATAFNAECGQ